MPKVKLVIEVSPEAWEAIPVVARWLSLPSDAQNADTASKLFELLLMDAFIEAAAGHSTVSYGDKNVTDAVDALLDPNVSLPVTITRLNNLVGATMGSTLTELFDDFAAEDPHDIWVKAVLAKTEDPMIWKLALASTYQVVKGDDRKTTATWKLIERTYHILRRSSVDNGQNPSDNGNVAPATKQPLKPQKE